MTLTATSVKKEQSNGVSSENKKTFKALVYHGAGKKAWEDKPKPTINKQVILTS